MRNLFSKSDSPSISLTSTPNKLRKSDKTRLSKSDDHLFSCLSSQTFIPEMPRSKSLSNVETLFNIDTTLRSDSLLKFTTAFESISVIGHATHDNDVTSRGSHVTSSEDVTRESLSELTLSEYLTPVSKSRSSVPWGGDLWVRVLDCMLGSTLLISIPLYLTDCACWFTWTNSTINKRGNLDLGLVHWKSVC